MKRKGFLWLLPAVPAGLLAAKSVRALGLGPLWTQHHIDVAIHYFGDAQRRFHLDRQLRYQAHKVTKALERQMLEMFEGDMAMARSFAKVWDA